MVADPVQWFLTCVLIASSLGVLLVKKPVHACLSFLATLLALAALYLSLSAQFIAVMQVLVYAGAILVIFMFVIVLFQDAYQQLSRHPQKSSPLLVGLASSLFVLAFGLVAYNLKGWARAADHLPKDFGTVQSIGRSLYVDFFFPFEAVILLFLIAVIGALYIGRKGV